MPRFETIFEDSLFEQFEKALKKNAQQIDNAQSYQLALRMLDNLSKQSARGFNKQIGESQRGELQPRPSDLKSLDAFISYLANNRFPYNSTLVAALALDTIPAPNTVLDKGTIPTGFTRFDSKLLNKVFAVNTTGLIDVLQNFQSQSVNEPYLKELIGYLVDDVKMDKQLNVPADSFQTPAINEATGEAVKQTPG